MAPVSLLKNAIGGGGGSSEFVIDCLYSSGSSMTSVYLDDKKNLSVFEGVVYAIRPQEISADTSNKSWGMFLFTLSITQTGGSGTVSGCDFIAALVDHFSKEYKCTEYPDSTCKGFYISFTDSPNKFLAPSTKFDQPANGMQGIFAIPIVKKTSSGTSDLSY